MTVQVQTSKGLINRDELEVNDVVEETGDARILQTVWTHNGEEVRRDATVSIFRGLDLTNTQGA